MSFYNLSRTQPTVADELSNALNGGFLPQSLLFSGSPGSSRLTGALDLSFSLLDDDRNRELLKTTQIVYLANRNFLVEVKCAINLYQRQHTDSSRINLLQCVRKILFQYHSALIEAYDKKTSSYFSEAEEIASALYDFDESREYSDKEITSFTSFLSKRLSSLFVSKGRKNQAATIDEIRAIQDWFSTGADTKIAILENIEECTEGAKNSLLKVLEEPDKNAYLILISSNAQKLLQTILSRVRRFTFPALTDKKISGFLQDRFKLYQNYASFEEFFFQEGSGDVEKEELERSVKGFSELIMSSSMPSASQKEELFSSIDNLNAYRYFTQKVSENIRLSMLNGRITPIGAKERVDIVNKWLQLSDTYNLSQRAALDGILREVMSVK